MPIAAFLDRDGVLNRRAGEHEYISRVEDFEILPGVARAIARLTASGILVLVVTNQRGIARKLVTSDLVDRMHSILRVAAESEGGRIDKFYVCPHDYANACDCRKPNPGMLLRAQREFGIDLSHSWMVGDSDSDIEAGRNAGCRTILIGPAASSSARSDFCADSLIDAVELIRSHTC
jgi:D-glycero-D-manno-heptose 1,7-bisphosphate phosphatase